MKKIFLLVTFIQINLIFSQSNFTANISISGQEQTDKIMEDFYWPAHPTTNLDDEHKGKDFRLKYNTTLSYILKDSFNIRMRVAFAQRNNHYEQILPLNQWIVDDKQNFVELCPSFGFCKKFGRFKFETGMEIPFFIIGKLSSKMLYTETSDSVNISKSIIGTEQIDGGLIFGINHYINIKTYLSKKMYFFSELNYGLLFARLGDKYEQFEEQTIPDYQTSYYSIEKSYSKTYFSPVSFQFGLGFDF